MTANPTADGCNVEILGSVPDLVDNYVDNTHTMLPLSSPCALRDINKCICYRIVCHGSEWNILHYFWSRLHISSMEAKIARLKKTVHLVAIRNIMSPQISNAQQQWYASSGHAQGQCLESPKRRTRRPNQASLKFYGIFRDGYNSSGSCCALTPIVA